MFSKGAILVFSFMGLHGALGDPFDNLSWEDLSKGDHFGKEHKIKDKVIKEGQSKPLSFIFKDNIKTDRKAQESSTVSFLNGMGEYFVCIMCIY